MQKIINTERWYVILPLNKKSGIVHIMDIVDFTKKTVTMRKPVETETRWDTKERYKRSSVQFLEKIS